MKNGLLLLTLLLTTSFSFSQQRSAYSRFGLGQPYNTNTTNVKTMGDISAAYIDSVQSNLNNPAVLGNRRFSTLDFAFNINTRTQRDNLHTNRVTESGLSYLAVSFPILESNKWGMSLGAKPLTFKNYDITTDYINDRYFREFEGDGNTNALFWQNGFEVIDGLRLGGELAVYFGTLKDITYNNMLNTTANSSGKETKQKLRGLVYTFGGQYDIEMNEETTITVGSTYQVQASIKDEISTDNFFFKITDFEYDDNDKLVVISRNDFSHEVVTESRTVDLPQRINVGAYINKSQKWSLGINAEMQNWSGFQAPFDNSTNVNYVNTLNLGLGGSFIPNFRNPTKAFEAFEYRYGGHYNKQSLEINGTTIEDYGVSFGVGFPIRRTLPGARFRQIPSMVDLSLSFGQLGTLENDLVQDGYIKTTIGLNLNDRWFERKKYN